MKAASILICRGQCICHGPAGSCLAGGAWHDRSGKIQPGYWGP
jgi:hypothetical protein